MCTFFIAMSGYKLSAPLIGEAIGILKKQITWGFISDLPWRPTLENLGVCRCTLSYFKKKLIIIRYKLTFRFKNTKRFNHQKLYNCNEMEFIFISIIEAILLLGQHFDSYLISNKCPYWTRIEKTIILENLVSVTNVCFQKTTSQTSHNIHWDF